MTSEKETSDTKPIRPRRSALYMPGANARALEKARSLDADCLLLDLEDAVAPDAKDEARTQICDALRDGGYGARELVVRINALDTPWGTDDLAALNALPEAARPHAVLAPKVSRVDEIDELVTDLPQGCALWIMVETPEAIFNIESLAARAADSPLAAFVMGTNDLAKEMRAALAKGRAPLMTALSLTLLAARRYGLTILDGVFNDIADEEGFMAECRQGADMGFDGKTLIHPSQLAMCNALFAPSEDEVAQARDVVAAFAAPENAGKGVLKINGKMTELLHRDMAARILAIAEAITARQEA
ncbi:MAG: (3S)-malyl-CoA thioesterase [Alphaproteobacteria bacterium]|nr:MAG: (3S)-malyl-CoA thioesterase [Alphaproteobacteria bacterium]